MKKSLLKNLSRALLVLACCLVANNAWADFNIYVCYTGEGTPNIHTWNCAPKGWSRVADWPGTPIISTFGTQTIGGKTWYVIPFEGYSTDYILNEGNNQTGNLSANDHKFIIYNGGASYEDVTYLYTKYVDVYTVVGAPAGQNESGVDDSFFGKTWDLNNTANEMTTTDYTVYTLHKQMMFQAGEHHYEYKAVRNHYWSRGQWPNGNVNKTLTIPSQGLYDVVFTLNLSDNSLTAVAYKNTSLATICSDGVINNGYKFGASNGNELIAVDYFTSGNDIFLQCKDQGEAIDKVYPGANQTDFMRAQGVQSGDWDQSNWIALWLQGGNNTDMLARAQAAKGHKITNVMGTLSDKNNYTVKVQYNDFTIGDAASYTPNVYCVANFNPANLGTGGTYFFMTPKVQEICHITYAQWNGSTFTVPSNSDFEGTLDLNYSFNSTPTPSLTEGNVYQFDAIVQLHDGNGAPALKANSGNYRVAPTNLTGGENNNFTAISTIETSNGQVKNVKYVNVAGVVSDRPFQGVNIVVTEYTDGSRTTAKIVK